MMMSFMPNRGCKPSAGDLVGSGSAVAPAWHTLLLVAVIVAVAITGSALGPSSANAASGGGSRFVAYAALLTVQWASLVYVCRMGRQSSALATLVGRRWHEPRRAAGDLALAVFSFGSIVAIDWAWTRGSTAARSALIPSTAAELGAWIVVACSVGFCEEVVYRGYLQRQSSALVGSAWGGIAIQAILFGVAHADQGLAGMGRVMTYGVLLGVVAQTRRSLIPGIAAHVAIDVTAAL
jgi:membrane protease YdiL (CAAX protease family)